MCHIELDLCKLLVHLTMQSLRYVLGILLDFSKILVPYWEKIINRLKNCKSSSDKDIMSNRDSESVVFNRGQKMALRAANVSIC